MSSRQPSSRKKKKSDLEKLRPILKYVPQVEPPSKEQEVSLEDKFFWTLGTLIIFLIASHTRLYGIQPTKTPDPLYWFREILASNRGTLMELGVSPVVTSSLVMQLMVGSGMIGVDPKNKDSTALFQTTQKFAALVITIGEALAYVTSGMYGSMSDLGLGNLVLIFLQLVFSGIIVMLLDELLQRGYGLGSGISLFIATNICETILWSAFSPKKIMTGSGLQYEGAVIALFHLLLTRKRMVPALKEAFYRQAPLPNLTSLIATIIVFIIVIYFQGFRIELPVKNSNLRGTHGTTKYPIKLFYTSNIPIILLTALVSNVYFFSHYITARFENNPVIGFFCGFVGKWKLNNNSNNNNYINFNYELSQPIGGLIYYISPPRTFYHLLSDPIHTIIYLIFVLSICGYFGHTWIRVSGSSPKDVAKQLKEQGLVIRGYREHATEEVLKRYIPIAAKFGGMAIGALTVFADFLGAIGTGTGILLAVTIIFEIFESGVREAQEKGYQLPTKIAW